MTEIKHYGKKMHAAVFGLAMGDALGVPYEFQERGAFQCTGMTGYGSHDQPAGTWSDDTSMTLATLASLKKNKRKIDIEDIRNNFLLWLNKAEYTAGNEVFDIGGTTLNALHGHPGNGVNDNGNGSLMRILPLAFTDCTDDEIVSVSAITHGHWISEKACIIYVHTARRLLDGEDIQDIIPDLKYDQPFERLQKINQLDESEIKSTGYVVDTLEAALWAVSHHRSVEKDSFKSAVLKAVNLGEDTDTVGAVTGGLAGIIYGIGREDDDWMETLRNKELIASCLW